jgi:hypothetical protein
MIQLPLSLNSTQSRRVLAQKSYNPIITRLSMGKRPFSRKNCNFFCKKVAFSRKKKKTTPSVTAVAVPVLPFLSLA